MQNKTIKLTPMAQSDMESIFMYGFIHFGEEIAHNYVKKMDDAFNYLRSYDIGLSRKELGEDICTLPVGKHVVFFRTDEDDIIVIRILHHSRDFGRHLM
jgi:toxin ParE1/3/4